VSTNGGAKKQKREATKKPRKAAAKQPSSWKATAKTHACKDGVRRRVYSDGQGGKAVKCKVGDRFVYRRL
jgi:hypothetical protein